MDIGVSLTRNGILTARQNGVIQHNDPPTTRLPNSRGAQDQGHTRQRKSFAGLRARGSGCLTVDESHKHITTKKRQGKVLTPCSQQACAVKCLSLWRGFAWKCSPPSQGCFVQIQKRKTHTHHTCPPVLCPWHTQFVND